MRLASELTWNSVLRPPFLRCSEHVTCASGPRRSAMRNARNAGPFLLLVVCLASGVPLAARSESESGEKVYQRTLKSTIWVLRPEGKRLSQGTGSLIDRAKHLVITNYNV